MILSHMTLKARASRAQEQAHEHVVKYAEECGVHYCDLRFVGGIVSNFPVIRKAVELMLKLRVRGPAAVSVM